MIDGEIGYLQRMLCGHLYEAGIAFRELDDEPLAGGLIDCWRVMQLLRRPSRVSDLAICLQG